MNEWNLQHEALPENIDDLARFMMVIPQKIEFVRAEIQALSKATLAEDVLAQKKEEMQVLAEMYIDASVKVGELLRKIPPRSGYKTPSSGENAKGYQSETFTKGKEEVYAEMGISKVQAHKFQMLAQYPDIIDYAKDQSRKSKKPLTMSRVIGMIKDHRNGCRVEAADFGKYEADELTDCQTFDNKTKQKARAAMMRDGTKLVEFLDKSRQLTIDDYHVECYLRSDGAEGPERAIRRVEVLIEMMEEFKGHLERRCDRPQAAQIQGDSREIHCEYLVS